MSFVRMPPRSKAHSAKTTGTGRHPDVKKKVRRMPVWDDTVNDLSAHKASPDDMARRKAATKSMNIDLVRAEVLKRRISKANKAKNSPALIRHRRQNALIREILGDQAEIAEALAQSDRVMSVVQDIFGDDPKKFRGLPNVTTAPGAPPDMDRCLPDGSKLEGPSKLDILSESVMNQTALNELVDQYESGSEQDDGTLEYRSHMDMHRFQQLLEREEKQQQKSKLKALLTHSMAERALQSTLDKMAKPVTDAEWLTEEAMPPSTPDQAAQSGAINDTLKVKKTKALTEQDKATQAKQPITEATHPQDLKSVLEILEDNITDYERQTGREPTFAQHEGASSFSGYTTTLVTAVSKLSCYLKESDLQLRTECTLREQLSEDVTHLRVLVDALTSDIIKSQEECANLGTEFHHHKRESDSSIYSLKQMLWARGIDVPPVLPQPRLATELGPQEAARLVGREQYPMSHGYTMDPPDRTGAQHSAASSYPAEPYQSLPSDYQNIQMGREAAPPMVPPHRTAADIARSYPSSLPNGADSTGAAPLQYDIPSSAYQVPRMPTSDPSWNIEPHSQPPVPGIADSITSGLPRMTLEDIRHREPLNRQQPASVVRSAGLSAAQNSFPATHPSSSDQQVQHQESIRMSNGLPRPNIPPSSQVSALNKQGHQLAHMLSPPVQADSPKPNGPKSMTAGNLPLHPGTGISINSQSTDPKVTAFQPSDMAYQINKSAFQQVPRPAPALKQPTIDKYPAYASSYLDPPTAVQQTTASHVDTEKPFLSRSQFGRSQPSLQHTMQQIIQQQQQQQSQAPVSTTAASEASTKPISQGAASSDTATSHLILTEEDQEMSDIQKQLEMLNRQHSEAQSKLRYILEQAEYPPKLAAELQSKGPSQVTTGPRPSVSPPISPITIQSEISDAPPQGLGRVIRVALPRMENDVSPHSEQLDKRLSSGSKSISNNRPDRSKVTKNAAWFALSSHVPTVKS